MNMKLKPILAALGFGMAVGVANAGIVLYAGGTGFEDDDLEWFQLDANANGRLGVGDQLWSVIEIKNTFSTNPTGFASPITGVELTGIAAVEVTGKFGGSLGTGADGTCSILFPCSYTFGEVTGGMQAMLLSILPGYAGPALAAGAIAALYSDPTPDLDVVAPNCVSQADCTAKAVDGTLWEVDGFDGDGDNLWFAGGVVNDLVSAVAAGNATAKFGSFNYALSVLFNGTGADLGKVNCAPFCGTGAGADGLVDMAGSGDLLGGAGLSNGAVARSDFDFQKNTIPEPSSLILVALGMLGLGATVRRKTR